jgi:ribonuclease-3
MKDLPKFKNQALFEQAFTHRSYLNEAKGNISSNERLEFLGDSILSFLVSEYLYKEYPQYNEGILTNLRSLLVNTKNLGTIARNLDFGSLLKLSKGEHEAQGRENQSLLADSFEAFVGALFIDQGIAAVAKFVDQTLLIGVKEFVEKKSFKDPKSLLQEHTQAKKLGSPLYKVTHEEGPAHAKIFTVSVFVANKIVGEGKGKSKQEAEEQAAKQALENTSQE